MLNEQEESGQNQLKILVFPSPIGYKLIPIFIFLH